jgi:hypothetical protein
MQVMGQGNNMRMECPRCSVVEVEPVMECRERQVNFQDEAPQQVLAPTSAGREMLAAYLAGTLIFGIGGLIIGAIAFRGHPQALGLGSLIGAVLGLLIGSKIARFDSMIGAGLVSGILPLVLCLRDGFRRGRMNVGALGRPDSLLAIAVIFGAGFVLGVILVGTKRLIHAALGRQAA